jgi:hypothetical protein
VNARGIERRLRALGDPTRAKHSLRFFRTGPGEYGEGDRFLGLTVPQIRALAREHKTCELGALEQLLQSPWHEARLLALVILVEQCKRGDAALREAIRALYLRNTHRINNWDLVDCSAAHIVGAGDRALLERLARSPSLWERRSPSSPRSRPSAATCSTMRCASPPCSSATRTISSTRRPGGCSARWAGATARPRSGSCGNTRRACLVLCCVTRSKGFRSDCGDNISQGEGRACPRRSKSSTR